MIVIEDVTWSVSPGNVVELSHANEDGEYRTETVRGEFFTDRDGSRRTIGLTQKVRETLRLPLEAYGNMSRTIGDLDRELAQVRIERDRAESWSRNVLDVLSSLSLLERLRLLFGGDPAKVLRDRGL